MRCDAGGERCGGRAAPLGTRCRAVPCLLGVAVTTVAWRTGITSRIRETCSILLWCPQRGARRGQCSRPCHRRLQQPHYPTCGASYCLVAPYCAFYCWQRLTEFAWRGLRAPAAAAAWQSVALAVCARRRALPVAGRCTRSPAATMSGSVELKPTDAAAARTRGASGSRAAVGGGAAGAAAATPAARHADAASGSMEVDPRATSNWGGQPGERGAGGGARGRQQAGADGRGPRPSRGHGNGLGRADSAYSEVEHRDRQPTIEKRARGATRTRLEDDDDPLITLAVRPLARRASPRRSVLTPVCCACVRRPCMRRTACTGGTRCGTGAARRGCTGCCTRRPTPPSTGSSPSASSASRRWSGPASSTT